MPMLVGIKSNEENYIMRERYIYMKSPYKKNKGNIYI